MADLTSEFLGVKTPNPFWLASAPPTDKAYNVERAFRAGWGADPGTAPYTVTSGASSVSTTSN
jgi:dihydroorotate dehydrogenase